MACAKTRLAEKVDIFIVQFFYPGVVLTGQVYLYWKSFTEAHFYTNSRKFSFQITLCLRTKEDDCTKGIANVFQQ